MITDQMDGVNIALKEKKKRVEEIAFRKTRLCIFLQNTRAEVWFGGVGGQETSDFSCPARVCYLNQLCNVMPASENTR